MASSTPDVAPSPADRHLLQRFSWGVNPQLLADATAVGGARAWLDAQLGAARTEDPADAVDRWWPHLGWSARRKLAAHDADEISAFEQGADFARWTLVRRLTTIWQTPDVIADFWSNLLYIPVADRPSFMHRPDFDRAVRANALAGFSDLLTATILHPAMLCYLDNARSTKDAPNENLGRELLELHTVGHDAGFSERDVRDSARLLTGYRVEPSGRCRAYYSPDDHATGPVKILDFTHPNSDPDGRAAVAAYLAYLAEHPSTAERIARRLAVRFVSDDPSRGLVSRLARVYRDSKTGIVPTLRALVEEPEFAESVDAKVRTPCEDLINTYRVLQVKIKRPTGEDGSAATAILPVATSMGQRPFDWPRPDGFPDVGEAWASASRVLGSWRVHKNTSGGVFPRTGIRYRPDKWWLPDLPARFDVVVDRLCQTLLAKASDERLLTVACKAVDLAPGDLVDHDSRLVKFRIPVLLLALLDTPDHMTR